MSGHCLCVAHPFGKHLSFLVVDRAIVNPVCYDPSRTWYISKMIVFVKSLADKSLKLFRTNTCGGNVGMFFGVQLGPLTLAKLFQVLWNPIHWGLFAFQIVCSTERVQSFADNFRFVNGVKISCLPISPAHWASNSTEDFLFIFFQLIPKLQIFHLAHF
jgi:hypothetical protein